MDKAFMYRIVYVLLLFLFLNSCDEKSIDFLPSPEDGLDFTSQSFSTSSENSSFTITPQYVDQDLGPWLHIGYSPELEDTSYALFQVNSEILKDYGLCIGDEEENQEVEQRGDIKFRLVFDGLYAPEGYSELKSYYYDEQIPDFSESSSDNHDDIKIMQIVNDIRATGNSLNIELDEEGYSGLIDLILLDVDECIFEDNQEDCDNSEYSGCDWNNAQCVNENIGSSVPSFVTWESLCDADDSPDYFYILFEFPSSDNTSSIYSSDIEWNNIFSVRMPSLMVSYEKETETSIVENRFDISNISIDPSMSIDAVLYSDDLYSWNFNCNDNTDQESCQNYEYCDWNNETCLWSGDIGDNAIIVNQNEISYDNGTLDNLGLFYGLQINDSANPIYNVESSSNGDTAFTINIELDDNTSDSLTFVLAANTFTYYNDNINGVFNSGENLSDFGLDGCEDEFETGDILLELDEVLCLLPYSWQDGLNDEEGYCYFDYNNDGIYSLCVDNEEESGYNPDGTENNGEFDWEDDGNDIFEETENSENWLDLGLDETDDDYETGCRSSSYPYGTSYKDQAGPNETYAELIESFGTIDFYKEIFILQNGTIELCGQQFWDNPNQEGVSGCSVCRIDDPNGDNKNIDPAEDDWIDQEDNIAGNGDDIWDEGEPFEKNGQWDWVDDGDGIFELNEDEYEPFLDFGIDQLENFNLEDPTQWNDMYDFGEQFFDTGLDGIFTGNEEGYCLECRQGNNYQDKIIDIVSGDVLFSEYEDYGIDQCENGFETGNQQNPCDSNQDNIFLNLDINRDDYNIDPNGDNYHSINNPEGLEGNGLYDCNSDNLEECEFLDEDVEFEASPNNYLINLGNPQYDYGLSGLQVYEQPNVGVSGTEKITLWISQIDEGEEDGSYAITVSMLSQVNIKNFEFQLLYNQISESEMMPTLIERQLIPFHYEDANEPYIYDFEGFSEDSEKYIKDVSLHSFPVLSDANTNDILISYGYGMQAKLYFNDFNDFLYNHDETIFLSHEQTRLVIYFDLPSDIYQIPTNGLSLKISGNIGDVLIEDFINPQTITNDTDRASIIIGPLIDELLSYSDDFYNNDDILNALSEHMILSIDSNSDYFSILKMSNEKLPHIDVFYSE